MLENYTHIKPKRGQIVDGEVVAITNETIILDVGAKRDAMVSKQEMSQLPETILRKYGYRLKKGWHKRLGPRR